MHRDEGHAHHVALEYHQRMLVCAAQTFGQKLGVPSKLETGLVHGLLANGSGHEGVNLAIAQIFNGALEGFEGSVTCFGRFLSPFNGHLVVEAVDKVQAVGHRLFGSIDKIEIGLYAECFGMVGGHLCRSIYYRSAHIKHQGVGKTAQDKFVAHTIGIAVGNTYSEQWATRCLRCLMRIILRLFGRHIMYAIVSDHRIFDFGDI